MRHQRVRDHLAPMRRRFALGPLAAAASEVRHRQVAQQRGLDHRAHAPRRSSRPRRGPPPRITLMPRARPAPPSAPSSPPASAPPPNVRPPRGEIGLEAGQRAAEQAPQHRGRAFVDTFAHLELRSHTGQDLALCLALEPVQRQQLGGARAHVVVEPRGQRRARLLDGVVGVGRAAEQRAEPADQPLDRIGEASRSLRCAGGRTPCAPDPARAPPSRARRWPRASAARRRTVAPSPRAPCHSSAACTARSSASSCTQQRAKASIGSTCTPARRPCRWRRQRSMSPASCASARGGPS